MSLRTTLQPLAASIRRAPLLWLVPAAAVITMLVKKARSRVLGFARLLTSRLLMSTSSDADSRLWLEDITGEKSLDWCRARNGHTISTIGEPADSHAYKRILEIADSKDKIPHVGRIGAAGSERYYVRAE
jgi:hypothetical protein